jgi:superkiller protein 3
MIVWLVAASFLWESSFVVAAQETQKAKPSSKPTTQQSPPKQVTPAKGVQGPLEQEAASLKKEEIELAKKLMLEFPDSNVPIVLMGNIQVRHGNTAEGLELWKKALQLNPRQANVYNGMAWVAMSKGQYQEAINHWQKVLQIQPKMSGAHVGIARALMALGKQIEAIGELEEENKISPKSGFSFYLLGHQYLQQKDYDKAKKNYEAAIAVEPNNTNAYYGLYTVYTRLNQPKKAEQFLASFKKLKAEDMKVLKDRNDAYSDLLTVRKGAAETYVTAGRLYLESGRFQDAEALLKRATAIDPNDTECLEWLVTLYQTTNRVMDALQICKKIIKLEPEDPVAYLNMGLFYARLQRTAEAEESFVKAIKLAPEKSDGYREIAQLYLKSDIKLQEAKNLAEKAVKLGPTAVNYMALSRTCDKNGDTAGAISAAKQAVELEPSNPIYQQIYQALQKRK